MKKITKILLPFASIGAIAGIAIPMASCSCNSSKVDYELTEWGDPLLQGSKKYYYKNIDAISKKATKTFACNVSATEPTSNDSNDGFGIVDSSGSPFLKYTVNSVYVGGTKFEKAESQTEMSANKWMFQGLGIIFFGGTLKGQKVEINLTFNDDCENVYAIIMPSYS